MDPHGPGFNSTMAAAAAGQALLEAANAGRSPLLPTQQDASLASLAPMMAAAAAGGVQPGLVDQRLKQAMTAAALQQAQPAAQVRENYISSI